MTTTEPTGPQMWQRLVQWQPAEAALLAQHIRALPDDWPLRVFGVGRPDAALLLPPGASGEQYPDRAPEIAPFDEIADLEDCPACEEAEGLCRWHEGFAAAHQAQTQAQLEAVKARPEISLREFLHWQADIAEAEDRGEEPPLLPAASSPAVWSDGDPLMQATAEAVYARCETGNGIVHDDPRSIAAAAAHAVRALQNAEVDPPDDEGDELVCVDMCGSCDACGMEVFGTPAEGWREAARFLRRTARDSADRAGALHGARLIEAELRRVADEQPTTTKTDPNALWVYTDGDDDMMHVGPHPRGGVVLTTASADVVSIYVQPAHVDQLIDAIRAAAGVRQDGAQPS